MRSLFGGACAGLAGSYLSLAYTGFWSANMTASKGWIAILLVVFVAWRPGRLIIGAYIFGAASVLQLHAQAAQFGIPSQLLTSVPYVVTIVALVILAWRYERLFSYVRCSLPSRFAIRKRNTTMITRRRTLATATLAGACALTLAAGSASAQGEKLKVGFIYVGPVGDFGYSFQHDVGRSAREKALGDRVETTYVESVSEADAERPSASWRRHSKSPRNTRM